MPPRRANVPGLVAVAVILLVVTRDGILDRMIAGLGESYEAAQALFDDAPSASDPRKTGSPESLVDWAVIGAPGRDFITSGPDAEAIAAFTGRSALDPIRVYVGRANEETPQERAVLALAELKRQGAFQREVLIIASPTGTGWMDPVSLWRAPPWMRAPPADDMSEHLLFVPVVTRFQLAVDRGPSFGFPPGFGRLQREIPANRPAAYNARLPSLWTGYPVESPRP